MCGQLIEASRAVAIERSILRRLGVAGRHARRARRGSRPPTSAAAGSRRSRASTLVRLVRSLDLERLREHDTEVVLRRLGRERGIGPWSVGVIALEGLGRYDHGLVGDLGLDEAARLPRGDGGSRPARRPSSWRRTRSGRGSPGCS